MDPRTIARLKISLNKVKPVVMRRIEVPVDIWLDQLHLTIQAAMGWTDSHLYELRAGDISWSTPYPDTDWTDDVLDARQAQLRAVLGGGRTKLTYLYDFGDDWEHTIKVERLAEPEAGILYPRLIAVSGRCPPEDCGGPWGYGDFIEAVKDPEHERHDEVIDWVGDDFDPDVVDAEELTAQVAALAKAWSRKPSAKRAGRR